jgi:hypothetical protein
MALIKKEEKQKTWPTQLLLLFSSLVFGLKIDVLAISLNQPV